MSRTRGRIVALRRFVAGLFSVSETRGAVAAFALFLVFAGVAQLVVGLHDAALAGSTPGAFPAAAVGIAVAGGVQFVAGVTLLQHRHYPLAVLCAARRCRSVVPAAFVLAALVGTYVFLAALASPSEQRRIVLGAAVLWVAVSVTGAYAFGRGTEVTRRQVGAVTVALLGTAVGVAEFWYQIEYTPGRGAVDDAVDLKATLERAAVRDGKIEVRAVIDYENAGHANMTVLGSVYTLTGARVVSCTRNATPNAVTRVFVGILPDPQRSRFMRDAWELQPAEVLAAGKFAGDVSTIGAGVAPRRELVFSIPDGEYQLLRLRASLLAVPNSLRVTDSADAAFPGDGNYYALWRVANHSWLHHLVAGGDQWLVARYEIATSDTSVHASPDMRVTVAATTPSWDRHVPDEETVHGLFAASGRPGTTGLIPPSSTGPTFNPGINRRPDAVPGTVPGGTAAPLADDELLLGPPLATPPDGAVLPADC